MHNWIQFQRNSLSIEDWQININIMKNLFKLKNHGIEVFINHVFVPAFDRRIHRRMVYKTKTSGKNKKEKKTCWMLKHMCFLFQVFRFFFIFISFCIGPTYITFAGDEYRCVLNVMCMNTRAKKQWWMTVEPKCLQYYSKRH